GLPQAQTLTLEAVGFNPAAGEAQRQLVGVANAVLAGEAVVAPQRGIAERAFAGVEHRDVGLIFVGHIQVIGTWFEGLTHRVAEPGSVTVEIQAAVQADNRYGTVWRVVEAGAVDAAVHTVTADQEGLVV